MDQNISSPGALDLSGLFPLQPQDVDQAAKLATALATYGLAGAPAFAPTPYALGLAAALSGEPWADPGPSAVEAPSVASSPSGSSPSAGGDGAAEDGSSGDALGPVPPSSVVPPDQCVQDVPDVTVDPSSQATQTSPSANEGPVQPSDGTTPAIYRTWALPNGQVATQYDAIQGNNVVYHHGDLAGEAGVYVDDPKGPDGPRTFFTPTGPKTLATVPGFTLSPEIGPNGEPYYDKVLWEAGGRQGFLRVDGHGNPVKAFALDNGEVNDAPSPFDFISPGEMADLAIARAVKAGAEPLLEGLGGRLAGSSTVEGGESAAAEIAEEPVIQLGGAHRDAQGISGYEAHHMPADAASPLPKGDGPAIAMLPEDHRLTASWGSKASAKLYRQRQADLIAQGRFRDAVQMDIDDIRENFGNKYDEAIRQMLDYINRRGY